MYESQLTPNSLLEAIREENIKINYTIKIILNFERTIFLKWD